MADGSVIIDSKLNTQGVEKGAEEIKKDFNALADAARETADTMQQELSDLGLSDANQVTERAAEVMKDNLTDAAETVAETFQDATEKMEESFEDAADSSKKASRKIENEFEDIEDAAEDAGEKIGDAFDGLSGKMGRGLSDLFVFDVTNILSGIADATEAVIDFGEECLEAASNLQEVQNVVDVAFPEMAEQMNDLTQQMEKTAGLSETMAKQFAGTFGIMAESLGFSEEAAYNMSEALTQLAGDVASFYNLSQEEAFTKLQSVFTGETESLKSLGVVMTQDALLNYALEKGIIDTTKSMEQQKEEAIELEKAQINLERAQSAHTQAMEQYEQGSIEAREATLKLQEAELDLATASDKAKASAKGSLDSLSEQEMAALRYEFVLDKLSAAQGDFVRTQNSWANQTRILSMQFDKLKTTVGKGLINAFTPLIQLLTQGVMPVLQGVADLFASAFEPTLIEEYTAAIQESMEAVQESVEETKESFEDTLVEIEKNAYMAEYYVEQLEKLEEAGLESAEAQRDYNYAVEQLKELLPELGIEIDKNTGKINVNKQAILDSIEATKQKATEEAIWKAADEYNDAIAEGVKGQYEIEKKIKELEDKVAQEIVKTAQELGIAYDEAEKRLDEYYNAVLAGETAIANTLVGGDEYIAARSALEAARIEKNRYGQIIESNKADRDNFIDYANTALINTEDSANGATGAIEGTTGAVNDYIEATDGAAESADNFVTSAQGTTNAMLDGKDAAGKGTEAVKEYTRQITLSREELEKYMQVTSIMGETYNMLRDQGKTHGEIRDLFAEKFDTDMVGEYAVALEMSRNFYENGYLGSESMAGAANKATKATEALAGSTQETTAVTEDLTGATKETTSATEGAADAQGEYNENLEETNKEAELLWFNIKRIENEYPKLRNAGYTDEFSRAAFSTILDVDAYKEVFDRVQKEYEETGSAVKETNEDIQDSIDVTMSEAADSIQETTDKMIESWEQVETEASNSCTTIQKSVDSLEGTTLYVDVVPRDKTNLFGYSSNYSNPFSTTPGYDPYQAAAYAMASTSYIPYLAKGAVIPPHAPFTAVLGDQRNGYNLEGPEDMFRGIVREELGALEGLDGIAEGTELLRQMLVLVSNIEIGDTTIGRAANRYNNKWSTIRGV